MTNEANESSRVCRRRCDLCRRARPASNHREKAVQHTTYRSVPRATCSTSIVRIAHSSLSSLPRADAQVTNVHRASSSGSKFQLRNSASSTPSMSRSVTRSRQNQLLGQLNVGVSAGKSTLGQTSRRINRANRCSTCRFGTKTIAVHKPPTIAEQRARQPHRGRAVENGIRASASRIFKSPAMK